MIEISSTLKASRATGITSSLTSKSLLLTDDEVVPSLPYGISHVEELPGRLFVAIVKGRTEKSFARDMLERGIPYFLPQIYQVRQWGRVRRTIEVPLFKRYVIVGGEDEEKTVQSSLFGMIPRRIYQTMSILDQKKARFQLKQLEQAIEADSYLQASSDAIVVGQQYKVTGKSPGSKPYEGLVGYVIGSGRQKRFMIQLECMAGSAVMDLDVDDADLEPV